MDETWIHHYTPESREGSKQRDQSRESAPKFPKTQQSPEKVMASVFWDAHEVIFIDYLVKGRTGSSYGLHFDSGVLKMKSYMRHRKMCNF